MKTNSPRIYNYSNLNEQDKKLIFEIVIAFAETLGTVIQEGISDGSIDNESEKSNSVKTMRTIFQNEISDKKTDPELFQKACNKVTNDMAIYSRYWLVDRIIRCINNYGDSREITAIDTNDYFYGFPENIDCYDKDIMNYILKGGGTQYE